MTLKTGDRIRETSTAPGTGSFTVNGAVQGAQTFASVLTSNGDTTWYCANNGTAWETGLLTRTSATVFARTIIFASSNGGAVVNFSSGLVDVFGDIPAIATPREKFTLDRLYYVRSDGNDGQTGRVDSAGGAWLTLQHAYDYLAANVDVAGHVAYISIGPGTFAGVTCNGSVAGTGTVNPVKFLGAGSGSTTIDGVGAHAILAYNGCAIAPSAVKLIGAYGLLAENGSIILIDSDVNFGVCSISQMLAKYSSDIEVETSSIAISGNSPTHALADTGSTITCFAKTINLSGSPVFSSGMLYATTGGQVVYPSCTISGAIGASSKKYYADLNGVIQAVGTTLPGSIAGTTATGGKCDADDSETIAGLLDLSGASAGQVKFPAVQNASVNPNTLDDYEEGTWTPVLSGFTAVGATTVSGTYTKIGRTVKINADISAATSLAATAGSSFITGLPFTPAAASVAAWANSFGSMTGNGTSIINTGSAIFTTTWTATAAVFTLSAEYTV